MPLLFRISYQQLRFLSNNFRTKITKSSHCETLDRKNLIESFELWVFIKILDKGKILLYGIYEWSLVEMVLNNPFYVTAVPLAITSYNRFTLGELIYSLKGVGLGSRHKPISNIKYDFQGRHEN